MSLGTTAGLVQPGVLVLRVNIENQILKVKHSNFEITVKIRKEKRKGEGTHIKPTQGLHPILSPSGVL